MRIVTDSTVDLPQKYVEEDRIGVLPLNGHLSKAIFEDRVAIWSDEFYHRLKNEPLLPNTAPAVAGSILGTHTGLSLAGIVTRPQP